MKMADQEYGMGLARSASFGSKRVVPGFEFRDGNDEQVFLAPWKRQCVQGSFFGADRASSMEDLPEEIVVRILCGVDHDDLKTLFLVSKAVREAALVAKKLHFEYSTPRKVLTFRRVEDFEDDVSDVDAPDAPKRSRIRRRRLSAKKLAGISVNLFGSDEMG